MTDTLDTSEPTESLRRQLRQDETVKWVVRKDLKTNLIAGVAGALPTAFFGLILGVFAGIATFAGTGSQTLASAAFVLVFLGLPGLVILSAVLQVTMGSTEYAATDDRFIKVVDGLTGMNMESVPVERVRDAEYSEDLADRLFGTGDVRIEGTRGSDSLVFNDAPDGDALLREIREQIRAIESDPEAA
jgi:uncharacterized membrane protein YdbT with pleckstrin-like domain